MVQPAIFECPSSKTIVGEQFEETKSWEILPKKFWMTHWKFLEFHLCTFGKHIYTDAAKQLNLHIGSSGGSNCNENSPTQESKKMLLTW